MSEPQLITITKRGDDPNEGLVKDLAGHLGLLEVIASRHGEDLVAELTSIAVIKQIESEELPKLRNAINTLKRWRKGLKNALKVKRKELKTSERQSIR
jgi:hypothetical protein